MDGTSVTIQKNEISDIREESISDRTDIKVPEHPPPGLLFINTTLYAAILPDFYFIISFYSQMVHLFHKIF